LGAPHARAGRRGISAARIACRSFTGIRYRGQSSWRRRRDGAGGRLGFCGRCNGYDQSKIQLGSSRIAESCTRRGRVNGIGPDRRSPDAVRHGGARCSGGAQARRSGRRAFHSWPGMRARTSWARWRVEIGSVRIGRSGRCARARKLRRHAHEDGVHRRTGPGRARLVAGRHRLRCALRWWCLWARRHRRMIRPTQRRRQRPQI